MTGILEKMGGSGMKFENLATCNHMKKAAVKVLLASIRSIHSNRMENILVALLMSGLDGPCCYMMKKVRIANLPWFV